MPSYTRTNPAGRILARRILPLAAGEGTYVPLRMSAIGELDPAGNRGLIQGLAGSRDRRIRTAASTALRTLTEPAP